MTDIGSIVAEIAAEMATETERRRVAEYTAAGGDRSGTVRHRRRDPDGACHGAGDA